MSVVPPEDTDIDLHSKNERNTPPSTSSPSINTPRFDRDTNSSQTDNKDSDSTTECNSNNLSTSTATSSPVSPISLSHLVGSWSHGCGARLSAFTAVSSSPQSSQLLDFHTNGHRLTSEVLSQNDDNISAAAIATSTSSTPVSPVSSTLTVPNLTTYHHHMSAAHHPGAGLRLYSKLDSAGEPPPPPPISLGGPAFPFAGLHRLSFSAGARLPLGPPGSLLGRKRRKENRQRRQRTTFTSDQTIKLEMEYHRTEYITRMRRVELAEMLSLTETQIKIWFQNRRAKDKRIEKAQIDQQYRNLGLPTPGSMCGFSPAFTGLCAPCCYCPTTVPAHGIPGVAPVLHSTFR
ncbi:uncharacterized protein [Diadema setosum]|uniref:uncharacterized protein n=1 Tax=Diadema setosum TaxID=31175 RepID=UPI003B3AD930